MANGFFTDRAVATSPFRLGGTGPSSVSALIPIPYGQVRVCTSLDIGTTTTPCPHLASVQDSNGNPLSVPAGGFGQLTADAQGRFGFQATPGNYQIQVAPTGSNTPQENYPITVSNFTLGVTPTLSGNNVFTGNNTIGSFNGTCYIDGVVWTSIQNAITSGTCGEINDRGVLAGAALGSLSITRQVKILLGPANYTFTGLTMSACAIIEGLGNQTFLQYTPTTGNAISLQLPATTNVKGCGFRDLRVYGAGASTGTTTGIFFNNNVVSAPVGAFLFENFELDSFVTGLTAATGASGLGFTTLLHSGIFGNGQNILIPSGATGERFELIDTEVNNLTTLSATWTGCFTVNASGINVRMVGGAIDYCQLVVTAGFVELGDATYIEDTNVVIGTCTTASVSGCAVSVSGSGTVVINALLATFNGSNSSFIGVTGNGNLIIQGGVINTTMGSGGAPISCVTGNGFLTINPSPVLGIFPGGASAYSSLWAGGCLGLAASGATPNNALGIPAVQVLGGNAADAGVIRTNSAAGGHTWITDINAATGSFAGTANDIYDYDATAGVNYLERGPGVGGARSPKFSTNSNCAVNSVSPAACGSAASGAFVVPTTTTTYTVNTTAVSATSRIFLQPRTNTGDLPGSPTCVSVAGGSPYSVSAQSAGSSFTFGLPSTTGQTCWNYWIVD